MSEVSGDTAKAAVIELVCPESMLHPGLANLLEVVVVARSAAHPIEIVRNDRMVRIWELKKIHRHVSSIARGRAHAQANLVSGISIFCQVSDVSRDDIRSLAKTFRSTPSSVATGSRISRTVAQKQKQRQGDIAQYFPKHGPILHSVTRSRSYEVRHARRQFPLVAGRRSDLMRLLSEDELLFVFLEKCLTRKAKAR